MTKVPSRNALSSLSSTRLHGWVYGVLWLPVHYLPQINFAILCAHYNVKPPIIQNKCDGCLLTFSVYCTLSCRNGGVVVVRWNEICDEIIHLSIQSFYPNCVHGKPLFCQVLSRSEEEVPHSRGIPETRIDMSIWGIWEIQIEAIIDVRLWYADAKTWKTEWMDNILPLWIKLDKGKHMQYCCDQQNHFSLFVLVVDGMMVKEAQAVLAALSWLLAAKMDGT